MLDKEGGYVFEERGLVKMKGKGEVVTYWLLRHQDGPQHRRVVMPGLGGSASCYVSGASNLDHHYQDQQPHLFVSLIQMDKKRKKYGSSGGTAGIGGSMSRRGSSTTFRGDQGSLVNLPGCGRLVKQESIGSIILHSPKFTKRKSRPFYTNDSRDALTRDYSPKQLNYNLNSSCSATNGAHHITCNVNNSGAVASFGPAIRTNSSWSNFRLPKSSASLSSSFAEVLENEADPIHEVAVDVERGAATYDSFTGKSHKKPFHYSSCAAHSAQSDTSEDLIDDNDGIVFRCISRPRRASTVPVAPSGSPLSDIEEQHTPLLSQSVCTGCDQIDEAASLQDDRSRQPLNPNNRTTVSNSIVASRHVARTQSIITPFDSIQNRGLAKRWRSCADMLSRRTSTIKCDCERVDRTQSTDGQAQPSAHQSSTTSSNRILQSGRQLSSQFLQYLNAKTTGARSHPTKKLTKPIGAPSSTFMCPHTSDQPRYHNRSDGDYDVSSELYSDPTNESDFNDLPSPIEKDDFV